MPIGAPEAPGRKKHSTNVSSASWLWAKKPWRVLEIWSLAGRIQPFWTDFGTSARRPE